MMLLLLLLLLVVVVVNVMITSCYCNDSDRPQRRGRHAQLFE